ncbi:MAG: alpha/beta fold hydrolase [Myxococcales bacterium]|nr:alpha/beta fold hydrolase [Myxococcales bacterium]
MLAAVKPVIVFAHGAGAPSSSGWMVGWRERLESLGEVHPFDYPYMARGSKRPDPMPTLVAAHQAAVDTALAGRDRPLVLAGKSMGSRVGCHLASESSGPRPLALICFGYPLLGQSGKLRDAVLLALATPVLFLQGDRDPLCPLGLLEQTRARMRAPSQLWVVAGGDHSLLSTKTALKRAGRTQDEVDQAILHTIARFLSAHDAGGPG